MQLNSADMYLSLLLSRSESVSTGKVAVKQVALDVDELQVKYWHRHLILHPEVSNPSISVDHLPCFQEENKPRGCIVASCNNLILCSHNGTFGCRTSRDIYYLCDPFTGQWVQLPPAPSDDSADVDIGMICDLADDYVPKGLGGPGLKPRECDSSNFIRQLAHRKFRVVRVLMPFVLEANGEFDVEMLSCDSGTWHWIQLRVRSPQPLQWKRGVMPAHAVACNGLIHWLSGSLELIVYDPYKSEVKAVIPRPSEATFFPPLVVLGASHGSVWATQYVDVRKPGHWYIWQLSPDYDGWILRHRVDQPDMQSFLMRFTYGSATSFAAFVAVHPHDHNILYCAWNQDPTVNELLIVCFNMATKTFKVVGKAPLSTCFRRQTFVLIRP